MPKSKTARGSKSVPLSYGGQTDLRSRFNMTASKDGMSVRVRGRELVGQLKTPANVAYGDNLLEFVLSPAVLPGRLSRFAEIYERFKFHALKVEYTPTVSATQAGAVVLAYDVDIDDATPVGTTSIARLLSNQSAAMLRVNAPFSYPVKMDLTMPYMYTAPAASAAEARTEYQGQVLVNWAGDSIATPTTYGHIFIDYDVELRNPQIEDIGLSCSFPTVTAPAPELYGSGSRSAVPGGSSSGGAYAKVVDGLVKLGSVALQTWLSNNLAQDGASFKRVYEQLPTWSEFFVKLARNETFKGIVMGNATFTPWYIPSTSVTDAKGCVTTVPAEIETCDGAATINLYGSSPYDSLFKTATGTAANTTDYTQLMYIANGGPKFIISGNADLAYGSRWADYMSVVSTTVATPAMVKMIEGNPPTCSVAPLYCSQPPVSPSETISLNGTTVEADVAATAFVAHWIHIVNDTDHPIYITAFRSAKAEGKRFIGAALGGLLSDESSPPASNATPLLIELDEVPSFVEPVRMSQTPSMLDSWQTIHAHAGRKSVVKEVAEDSAAAPFGAGDVGFVLPTLPVRR